MNIFRPSYKISSFFTFFLFFSFITISLLKGQLADTPWPKFMHDNTNSGQSWIYGPDQPHRKLRKNIPILTGPIIGNNGTLYFNASSNFYAINNEDFSIKWTYHLQYASFFATPTISNDGTIYVTGDKLYALNADGTLKWTFSADSDVHTSPAIGSDGTVYFGSVDSCLYAVNSNGQLDWKFETGLSIYSSPALKNSNIYFSSDSLYCLNYDGTVNWSYDISSLFFSPFVAANGTIYITDNNNLYALNNDGTLKWIFDSFDGQINSSPALNYQGIIYIGTKGSNGKLYAINPDGVLAWTFSSNNSAVGNVMIDVSRKIFAIFDDRNLYALDDDGSVLWNHPTDYNYPNTPVLGSDGTLYFGDGAYIYAVEQARPLVSFSEDTLNFNQVLIGKSSDKSILITNTGFADLSIISTQIAGDHSTEFEIIAGGGQSVIQPNNSQEIQIRCSPLSTGLKNAFFILKSNALSSPDTVILTANGIETPILSLSMHQINFDDTHVNSSSTQNIMIANDGNADLNIEEIHIIGNDSLEFSFLFNSLPYIISPSNFEYLELIFSPNSINSKSAQLIINANSGSISDTVLLQGKGYPLANSAWPAFRNNIKRTGSCDIIGPYNPAVKWKFTANSNITASPVVGPNGIIYQGIGGNLYAFHPDGTQKWIYNAPYNNLTTPVIDYNGIIYLISHDQLIAVNPDGIEQWTFSTGNYIHSAPIIGYDGTIYFCSTDKKIYAVKPDGILKWTYDFIYWWSYGSAAVGHDGNIYVGCESGSLYCFDPDGNLLWTYPYAGKVIGSPAIGTDQTIYFGNGENEFFAIYPTGTPGNTLKWKYQANGPIESSPAIDNYNNIYFGSDDNSLYALNPDGTLKWSFLTGGFIKSSPAMDAYGYIYFGSYDKYLYALGSDGTLKWKFLTDGPIVDSPAIDSLGRIIFVSGDKNLYVLGNPDQQYSISLLPQDLRFGSVPVNQIKDAVACIKNTGTSVLTINNIFKQGVNADEFELLNGGGSSTVLLNAVHELNIRFSPTSEGFKSAIFIVNSNAYSSPDTINIYGYSGTNALANTSWPMFKHDVKHSGTTSLSGPKKPEIIWEGTQSTGMYTNQSATIGYNEMILVSAFKELITFDSSGVLLWNYETNGQITTSSISRDGTIYFGSEDGYLYALNNDGSLKWKFFATHMIRSAPVVDSIGTIYFGCYDKKFYAVHPDGSVKWSCYVNDDFISSPALDSDGNIYVGNNNDSLYVFYPDGTIKWTFYTDGPMYSSPVISNDGIIYFGTASKNRFYSLNNDGSLKWYFTMPYGVSSSPSIGQNGTIYVGCADKLMYAFNPDGTIKWKYTTAGIIKSSPSVDGNGNIYFGSEDNFLYSVKPDGNLNWKMDLNGDILGNPAIGKNNTIYVGTYNYDFGFYAIAEAKPEISLDSWQIDFGDVLVFNSKDSVISISNIGLGDLIISDLAISGNDFSQFNFSYSDLPDTLLTNEPGFVNLTFSPQELGYKNSYFIIHSNSLSSPDSIELSGIGLNNPPVWTAVPDTSFNEDDSLLINKEFLINFVNDPDSPADSLNFELFSNQLNITLMGNNFILKSPVNWFGQDLMSLIVTDQKNASDTTNWIININPINDPPNVLSIPSIIFEEDSSYSFDLDNYVYDVDNDTTEISWSISFPDETKEYFKLSQSKVPFINNDNFKVNQSLMLNVNKNRNDNLKTGSSLFFLNYGANDSLIIELDSFTHIVKISATSNFFGFDLPIIFTATDDSMASDSDTTFVTVMPVNDPPRILNIPMISFCEDDTLKYEKANLFPYIQDPETPDSNLTINIFSGSKVYIINQDTLFLFYADSNWFGLDTLKLFISDSFYVDSSFLYVKISPINDPPIISDLPDTIRFRSDSTVTLDLWDYVSDIETSDSLLSYNFNATNDSLFYNFNSNIGILRLLSFPIYHGTTNLYISVSDDSNAIAQDSILVIVEMLTGIFDKELEIPKVFSISQNYPNPFNPITHIRFGLPKASDVKIEVYNILGQKVATLFDERKPAGYHVVDFDGKDFASGLYYYRIQASNPSAGSPKGQVGHVFQQVKKMLLMK